MAANSARFGRDFACCVPQRMIGVPMPSKHVLPAATFALLAMTSQLAVAQASAPAAADKAGRVATAASAGTAASAPSTKSSKKRAEQKVPRKTDASSKKRTTGEATFR